MSDNKGRGGKPNNRGKTRGGGRGGGRGGHSGPGNPSGEVRDGLLGRGPFPNRGGHAHQDHPGAQQGKSRGMSWYMYTFMCSNEILRKN